MLEDKYYIYRHLKPNGEVFYIGIGGTKDYKRAYVKKRRSSYWNNIVSKHGYEVQILKSNMSLEEVCELEVILIAHYGRRDLGLGTLVNLTDGGEGLVGYIYTKEQLEYRNSCLPRGAEHIAARILLSIQTGVFYYTIDEAALAYNIASTTLRNMLTGHRRNKTDLVYAESEEGSNYPIIPKIKDYAPPVEYDPKNHGAKKVINTTTLEVWDCIKYAAESNKVNYRTLSNYLNGNRKNKTNLMFYIEQ